MANYPKNFAQDAAYQSHTGRLTGLWFLPKLAQGLNTTTTNNNNALELKAISRGWTALADLGLLCEVPRTHSETPHSV
jgi:hypothetical protein